MHQPEGFIVEGKEDHVCQLRRSLYGLKHLQDSGTSALTAL
jgi:hypothetical protein